MYKAIINYFDADNVYRGNDVSDGYCFESESEAREWADDYAPDRMMQSYHQDMDLDRYVIIIRSGDE